MEETADCCGGGEILFAAIRQRLPSAVVPSSTAASYSATDDLDTDPDTVFVPAPGGRSVRVMAIAAESRAGALEAERDPLR